MTLTHQWVAVVIGLIFIAAVLAQLDDYFRR